jgi:hypothetical protein
MRSLDARNAAIGSILTSNQRTTNAKSPAAHDGPQKSPARERDTATGGPTYFSGEAERMLRLVRCNRELPHADHEGVKCRRGHRAFQQRLPRTLPRDHDLGCREIPLSVRIFRSRSVD